MKALSIYWGNSASSPITKLAYRPALKNYQPNFGKILIQEQMHGIAGQIVTPKSAKDWCLDVPKGDYLITQAPNLSLGVLTADCLPIVFFDQAQQVIAIAHAGWRGSVAGIAQVVVTKLVENFGVNPQSLQIFFGPSARSCCYEVDQAFIANLAEDQNGLNCIKKRGESYFFDVSDYNMLCLKNLGVPVANFNLQDNLCTICDVGYCSYRNQGNQTSLQLSLVTLR
jgi:YfiH family protein